MNTYKKTMLSLMTIAVISFMSSCIVVNHGAPHHHWHQGGAHEDVIVR